MAAPSFIPAGDPDHPVAFVNVDALALHLLRQRPGRRLDLLAQGCSRNGAAEFPVVAVFALKPRQLAATELARRALDADGGDVLPLQDEWLGWAAGERACDPVELEQALRRMRSAGGLAA